MSTAGKQQAAGELRRNPAGTTAATSAEKNHSTEFFPGGSILCQCACFRNLMVEIIESVFFGSFEFMPPFLLLSRQPLQEGPIFIILSLTFTFEFSLPGFNFSHS